jgi:hypothetical protein
VTTSGTPTLVLSADNANTAAGQGLGVAESLLMAGQLAADELRVVARSGRAALQNVCSNGGLVSYSWRDTDGNGRLGVGDEVSVEYRDCAVALLDDVATGTITLRLTAAEDVLAGRLAARLSTGAGLRLRDSESQGVRAQLLGSLQVARTGDAWGHRISVTSDSADDFRLEVSGAAGTAVERIQRVNLTRSLQFDAARAQLSGSLRYSSEALQGSIDLAVTQPLQAYLNTYPETGRIEVLGANGTKVVVTPHFVVGSESARVEVDRNGDGVIDAGNDVPWSTFVTGFLWVDAAQNWSSSLTAYRANDFRLLSAGKPGAATGDRVGVSDPLVVRFSRPLTTSVSTSYRLVDTGDYVEYSYNGSGGVVVPVDVETRGAQAVITPRQPLAYGHQYQLQVSTNGSFDGATTVFLTDALNNPLSVYSGQLGTLSTSDALWLKVSGGGTASLLTSGQVVTLTASTPRAQAAPSVHWTQVGGPPLTFDNPDAASTGVRLVGSVPGGSATATVRVTVTDALGATSSATTTIRLLDAATLAGRAWVLFFRSDTGDYIGGGQSRLFSSLDGTATPNVASGQVAMSFSGSDTTNGPTTYGWTLNLAAPNGAPLAVGTYTDAIRTPFRGSLAGLELTGDGRGCNSIVGKFQVLEVAYDSSGQLLRLAADIEQHCEGLQPALWGSVRYNSTLPPNLSVGSSTASR